MPKSTAIYLVHNIRYSEPCLTPNSPGYIQHTHIPIFTCLPCGCARKYLSWKMGGRGGVRGGFCPMVRCGFCPMFLICSNCMALNTSEVLHTHATSAVAVIGAHLGLRCGLSNTRSNKHRDKEEARSCHRTQTAKGAEEWQDESRRRWRQVLVKN
jgi:hypothetical protein